MLACSIDIYMRGRLMGVLSEVTGGPQCQVSILRNNNVALSNLRNDHVTL